ncbi:hypothetical protein IKE67_08380 [bacterium]|nr:hypothetical protein [bacterium]
MEQLNKIQLKAEILTVITKLQTISDTSKVNDIIKVLAAQEDKKLLLDLLMREFIKTKEDKAFIISFLMLKLTDKEHLENALWTSLKSPTVSDYNKALILNLLKDMGNRVDYNEIDEYFESPEDIIDSETRELLHTAIMNPEAQIDFLDFLEALPYEDKLTLVQSLGDDYSEDALANILIPLFVHDPTSRIAIVALNILGQTKSQLALHALTEVLEYADEDIVPAIKRNISALKLSGVREDNAIDFYKDVLSESKPYECYTSYPDGHGNQALIFSREREDETIQFLAVVVNDKWGIVDCFGFNQITKDEFEKIVSRFYGDEDSVYINQTVLKALLNQAENIVHRNGEIVSYEYVCWRTITSDIPIEPVPMEFIMEDKFKKEELSKNDFDKICLSDVAQKWFLDTDFSDEFSEFIINLNKEYHKGDYSIDLDKMIEDNIDEIIPKKDTKKWQKRILTSAYLKYLANEKNEAQRLYSLYFDEKAMHQMFINIVRKSIYEYYVGLKFRIKEESQTSSIFTRNRGEIRREFSLEELEKIIAEIENRWVSD